MRLTADDMREVIRAKRDGIDVTEAGSAAVKRFIRETKALVDEVEAVFPLESDEVAFEDPEDAADMLDDADDEEDE